MEVFCPSVTSSLIELKDRTLDGDVSSLALFYSTARMIRRRCIKDVGDFTFPCPASILSCLLSSLRSEALCVRLHSSAHQLPFCSRPDRRGCSLFSASLPFILRVKYQYCSPRSQCSESRVTLAVPSKQAFHFYRVFKIYLFSLALFHI